MIQSKKILASLPYVLKSIDLPNLGKKEQGKVRDIYRVNGKRITITTDRQSAFDVVLGHIPYKGAVLNMLASFWFDKTKQIIPNHKISSPDPNVLISHNLVGIPIEMIVRGYMSGVTKTSIWYSYQKGERNIYGIKFPDGLKKNDKLPYPVITPTTHGGGKGGHDERLTRKQIISNQIKLANGEVVTEKLYKQMEKAALALFEYGSKLCRRHGLILVDTKYEFGLHNGKLMLMDEIHTPDSSRFWKADTYKVRVKKGLEPENFDKEFLRLWYAERGFKGDGKPPKMSKELISMLSQRYIAVYEKITGEKFNAFSYPIEERIIANVQKINVTNGKSSGEKITYSQVGDNYDTKDPIKKLTQISARATAKHLKRHGFEEVSETRGESAFVWKQGNTYMATMIEGLGTKNLVADETRKITGKTYYDVIAQDTVAYIINDLISVGAKPLTIHAYWAIEDNSWLQDKERMRDLIAGWKKACDLSGATWGGGETPTLKQVVVPGTIDLGGSAVGIIGPKKRLVTDKKLREGDRILLVKSSGINASGISLARAIAKKLPKGYATKLPSGKLYGEAVLTPSNIYARLVETLQDGGIDIHYMNYISGHGMRKVMRARGKFTYVVEKIFEPQEVFLFIQKHANLTDEEIYDTYNMGMDYVIFVPEKQIKKAQKIVTSCKFHSIDAGYIEKGERQVIIKPKNITYKGDRLDLR